MAKKSTDNQQDKYKQLLNKASKLLVKSVFNNASFSMTEEEKRIACAALVQAVQKEAENLRLVKRGK